MLACAVLAGGLARDEDSPPAPSREGRATPASIARRSSLVGCAQLGVRYFAAGCSLDVQLASCRYLPLSAARVLASQARRSCLLHCSSPLDSLFNSIEAARLQASKRRLRETPWLQWSRCSLNERLPTPCRSLRWVLGYRNAPLLGHRGARCSPGDAPLPWKLHHGLPKLELLAKGSDDHVAAARL
ncbi:hypothetical protein Dimus_037308 [Dionaea muscipula]